MKVFFPCKHIPESMYYVGHHADKIVQVSVSTFDEHENRTMNVYPTYDSEQKMALYAQHINKPCAVQKADGSCSYFSPVTKGGLIVAHSSQSDDLALRASILGDPLQKEA
jgi:hypothetical protein